MRVTRFYETRLLEASQEMEGLFEFIHLQERWEKERPFLSSFCEKCGNKSETVEWRINKFEAESHDCYMHFFYCDSCFYHPSIEV